MSSPAPLPDALLSDALLRWYDRHRRDLPWRRTRDPYPIWLSEVMAQQTRVEVVIPYWERFLERFPTVDDLARAPLDDVLALWSGLGYYRRARQLHRAAAGVVERGGFPESSEELRELPGIGPYTAAAVASIAFGEVVPVVDGNVERVTARLLAEEGDPKRSAVRRRLRAAAAELLDPGRPGDSNQALMELGATVCTPTAPKCLLCPLRGECRAVAEGRAEELPAKRTRRAPVRQVLLVALVERDGRHLFFRRGDDAELMAGLWELPWVEVEPASSGAAELASRLGSRYGGAWSLGEPVAAVRHSITHRAIELQVRRARVEAEGAVAEGPAAGWYGEAERETLAMSSMVGKIFAAVGAADG